MIRREKTKTKHRRKTEMVKEQEERRVTVAEGKGKHWEGMEGTEWAGVRGCFQLTVLVTISSGQPLYGAN